MAGHEADKCLAELELDAILSEIELNETDHGNSHRFSHGQNFFQSHHLQPVVPVPPVPSEQSSPFSTPDTSRTPSPTPSQSGLQSPTPSQFSNNDSTPNSPSLSCLSCPSSPVCSPPITPRSHSNLGRVFSDRLHGPIKREDPLNSDENRPFYGKAAGMTAACKHCNKAHIKCDGRFPCLACRRRNTRCEYAPPQKRGPKAGAAAALKATLNSQERLIKELQGEMEKAKKAAKDWQMKFYVVDKERERLVNTLRGFVAPHSPIGKRMRDEV